MRTCGRYFWRRRVADTVKPWGQMTGNVACGALERAHRASAAVIPRPACSRPSPAAAMLRDLRRRPAEQIRGPRLLWGATALVNTAGLAQVAYFLIGRRRSTEPLGPPCPSTSPPRRGRHACSEALTAASTCSRVVGNTGTGLSVGPIEQLDLGAAEDDALARRRSTSRVDDSLVRPPRLVADDAQAQLVVDDPVHARRGPRRPGPAPSSRAPASRSR